MDRQGVRARGELKRRRRAPVTSPYLMHWIFAAARALVFNMLNIIVCNCGAFLRLPAETECRQARCPACGKIHDVPLEGESEAGGSAEPGETATPAQWSPPLVAILVGALVWAVGATALFAGKQLEIHRINAAAKAGVRGAVETRDALRQRAESELAKARTERANAVSETDRLKDTANDFARVEAQSTTELARTEAKLAAVQKDLQVPIKDASTVESELQNHEKKRRSGPSLNTGDAAIVWSAAGYVLVATDAAWYDFVDAEDFTDKASAKDKLGALIKSHGVYLVKAETRVKITEAGWTTMKIQVHDDDDGLIEGWVRIQFVRPADR